MDSILGKKALSGCREKWGGEVTDRVTTGVARNPRADKYYLHKYYE